MCGVEAAWVNHSAVVSCLSNGVRLANRAARQRGSRARIWTGIWPHPSISRPSSTIVNLPQPPGQSRTDALTCVLGTRAIFVAVSINSNKVAVASSLFLCLSLAKPAWAAEPPSSPQCSTARQFSRSADPAAIHRLSPLAVLPCTTSTLYVQSLADRLEQRLEHDVSRGVPDVPDLPSCPPPPFSPLSPLLPGSKPPQSHQHGFRLPAALRKDPPPSLAAPDPRRSKGGEVDAGVGRARESGGPVLGPPPSFSGSALISCRWVLSSLHEDQSARSEAVRGGGTISRPQHFSAGGGSPVSCATATRYQRVGRVLS